MCPSVAKFLEGLVQITGYDPILWVRKVKMDQITTIIFDMYETLAENNTQLWLDMFDRICEDQGLSTTPQALFDKWKPPEMVFRKVRLNFEEPEKSPPFKSYEEAWSDCFVVAFEELGLDGDAASAAREAIRDMGDRDPYADAVEALPELQRRWRTGVLSNADDDYLYPLMHRNGWQFEAVLSSEGARAYKPLPSAFLKIMEMMAVDPREALYVGDNPYDDVLGAKSVGMSAAWVNRSGIVYDPRFPKPDYEVSSLGQLISALENHR